MSSIVNDSPREEQEVDDSSKEGVDSIGDNMEDKLENNANLPQTENLSADDKPAVLLEQASDNTEAPELLSPDRNSSSSEENTASVGGFNQQQDVANRDNAGLERQGVENDDTVDVAGQANRTDKTNEVAQDSTPNIAVEGNKGNEAKQKGRAREPGEGQPDVPEKGDSGQSQAIQNIEEKRDTVASKDGTYIIKEAQPESHTSQQSEVQHSGARDDLKVSDEDGEQQSQTSQEHGTPQGSALKEGDELGRRQGQASQESEIHEDSSKSRTSQKNELQACQEEKTIDQKVNSSHEKHEIYNGRENEVHLDSKLLKDGQSFVKADDQGCHQSSPKNQAASNKIENHVDLGVVHDSLKRADDHMIRFGKLDDLGDKEQASENRDVLNKGNTHASEESIELDDSYSTPKKNTRITKDDSVPSKTSRRLSGETVLTRTFVEEVKGVAHQKTQKKSLWGRVMGQSSPGNDAPKKSIFGFAKTVAKRPSDGNPPGSVSIMIVGTEGFPNLKKHEKAKRHCTCDVIGSKTGTFKTRKVENTANPTWNHPIRVLNYHHMNCIQFAVMDEDILGVGCLNTSDFYPHGFKGSLDLKDNDDKPLKAKLKLVVNAKPPLGGIAESEDRGQEAASDNAPKHLMTKSRRTAMVMHSGGDLEEDIDGLLRTPVSSDYDYEDSAEDDATKGLSDYREGDDELLKMRSRAQCNIAGMELQGHREETDPLKGLPYDLTSRTWEPHLVWICGQKVKPANFSSDLHKHLALAALSAGTSSVQTNIVRLRGARQGGWNLRWDCAASCKVQSPTPRRANDKYTTKRVTNTPIPTWNEVCDFPEVTQDSTLEFAVEGIDKDGWPKRERILGHVGLPKESIGEQGFHGALKLLNTKHTIEAHLQIEVAVLALWDDEADQRVPLQDCRAWLQRMDAEHARKCKASFHGEDDDSRNFEKQENVSEDIELGPCTVYDLLYADAVRRRCDKQLNDSIDDIQYTSSVMKKGWVLKEVDNFLSRMYADDYSVQDLDLEPAKVKNPRAHLMCVNLPDDAAENQQDICNAELAFIRADKLLRKDFSSSSEDSEEWENTASDMAPSSFLSMSIQGRVKRSNAGAKHVRRRVTRPLVQQKADAQRAIPRGQYHKQRANFRQQLVL